MIGISSELYLVVVVIRQLLHYNADYLQGGRYRYDSLSTGGGFARPLLHPVRVTVIKTITTRFYSLNR